MMISKLQCLYVFLLLYGGAIIAIFVRAFPRRRLLADHARLLGSRQVGPSESLARRMLLSIPRQSMALSELGRSIGRAPIEVQRRHRWFRMLTWLSIALIVLLVIFSLATHKVCAT